MTQASSLASLLVFVFTLRFSRKGAPMSTATRDMIRGCTLDELREKQCVVVRGADRPIALFYNEGDARAVDTRCPHRGFPLSRGSCEKGMITCHWHHARFDAASG